MRKSLLILCWLIAAPGALLALLIILPAPSYYLWKVAVGVSEWSVWLLLAGLTSLSCGACTLRSGRRSASAWIGITLSLVTVVCAGVPVVGAYRIAAQRGVSLSWRRYFLGAGEAAALALIDVQRDVEFASPGGDPLRLDVYQPPYPTPREPQTGGATRPLSPAVIVIHGGAWSGGEKSDFESYDRWLATGGRVVFDVEYRLANDARRFPAQLADIKCAIGWVGNHAAQYHVDPGRLALLGRSAGGQLALLAAYTATDPTPGPGSCEAQETRVRAVISFYGPTDLAWDYTHPGRPDVIDTPRVLENYLGGSPAAASQAYTAASPAERVSAQAPPTLFLHGGHDQIVLAENVERIMPKLAAAGVTFTYVYLPWANHGFDYNFNGWSSQIAQAEIDKFLDGHL
ncbi:MAG: alpha/beta hydrolase fold domain-containing protein [Pyrinomonadaceae bacterium]